MKIIGLAGYGGVGKDEVGRILIERAGFRRFAKGDLLKDAAYGINPRVGDPACTSQHLREVVDQFGWDTLKTVSGGREFLQNLADEVVRVCGRDVWNDAVFRMIEEGADPDDCIVLTRLSLPSEAGMVKEHGGVMWRIVRPGYGPANDHPNEVALDDWHYDVTVNNDGDLEQLELTVALALGKSEELFGRQPVQ